MARSTALERRRRIRELEAQVRALEGSSRVLSESPIDVKVVVGTGWAGVDAGLRVGRVGKDAGSGAVIEEHGLARGALHEWFGLGRAPRGARAPAAARTRRWMPALILLAHLARRALLEGEGSSTKVLWIGRSVWPYPQLLVRETSGAPACVGGGAENELLARSLWIDPPDAASCLWAIDVALRCPSVSVVVADARSFGMADTRRLQLAAQTGAALALLARPPWELGTLSAAATRWQVSLLPAPPEAVHFPRFQVELLRCKGIQRFQRAPLARVSMPSPSDADALAAWVLEYDRAQGRLVECSAPSEQGASQVSPRAATANVPRTA